MNVKLGSILLAATIGALLGIISCFLIGQDAMPRVHKLQQPLLISGGDAASGVFTLLPKGTSLYYDQAFPEGFVRYKVYVNVEGVQLNSNEAEDEFWIDPLTAFPIEKDQLRMLLRDYPLSRADLEAILKQGHISKRDIRELLTEYSE